VKTAERSGGEENEESEAAQRHENLAQPMAYTIFNHPSA